MVFALKKDLSCQICGKYYKFSFTMAEILLSLTIIGVVAAITLPSLTGNINERVWKTQKAALYARISQAIPLLPSLNGYGIYNGTWSDDDGTVSVSVTADTAAQVFVTEGLSKVMKINNICNATGTTSEARLASFKDCGINSTLKPLNGDKISFPTTLNELNPKFNDTVNYRGELNPHRHVNTKAAAFETLNGESIVVFYNPLCITFNNNHTVSAYGEVNTHVYTQPHMCANFVYDLNGRKGPNTVGKDIGFITALYPIDSHVVSPSPLPNDIDNGTYPSVAYLCKDQGARLPNSEELMSMFYNQRLLGNFESFYWSSSIIRKSEDDNAQETTPYRPGYGSARVSSNHAWVLIGDSGELYMLGFVNSANRVRCIE